MSLTTTIVGALVALVARPARTDKEDPRFIAGYDAGLNDGRLEVERLQRELALTQELLAHWRDEAARLARENRDRREMQAAVAQQAMAYARQAQAQARLAGLAPQMQAFEGFRNCLPSRTQLWGAQHGLVQQLNDNMAQGVR